MIPAVLTIDSDFFSRELPEWDFGHNENNLIMGTDIVWNARYASVDLHKETSLNYADCLPEDLFSMFLKHGHKIDKQTRIGAGWTHKYSYDFFKNIDFEYLINVDAHHDRYGKTSKIIDCENWVEKLFQRHPFAYYWITPKWKSIENEDEHDALYGCSLNYFLETALPYNIKAVYIAQSPMWLPPHHDYDVFHPLCDTLKSITKKKFFDYDQQILVRMCVGKEEAEKMRKESKINKIKIN